MAEDPRTIAPLTKLQREALRLLNDMEERKRRPLEPGDAGTYTATWHDDYTVGLHWRTARALARRGLIVIDPTGAVFDEPADIFLTDAGRVRG